MDNKVAVWLGLFILAAIGWDVFFNDTKALLFLGKELLKLIDTMEFWA